MLKQMLRDLGRQPSQDDGYWRGQDDAAMNAFSLLEGLPYTSGIVTAAHCARLIARWDAQFGAGLQAAKKFYALPGAGQQAAADTAQLQCLVRGYQWDPVNRTCTKPLYTATGPPPTMTAEEECAYTGGIWDPTLGLCTYPSPPSWWERQSMGMKVAVVGGGAVAAGGLIWALTR